MGKKNKGQPKAYIPPADRKFVVVTNPWGYLTTNMQVTFNQVSAWFEVMLRDRHPNTRPLGVYYQRTHTTLIVEFDSSVEIQQYLGAHRYTAFLTLPNVSPNALACVYQYNYRRFNHPDRTNWSTGYPEYRDIPLNFPIKYPYPPPEFPPPPTVAYAIPAKLDLNLPPLIHDPPPPVIPESPGASSALPHPSPTPSERPREEALSTSSSPPATLQSLFRDYNPPSHYRPPSPDRDSPPPQHQTRSPAPSAPSIPPPNSKLQKYDPYEEEEAAERLLRSHAPLKDEQDDTGPLVKDEPMEDVKPFIKPEPVELAIGSEPPDNHKPVIKDEVSDRAETLMSDAALDFLQSIIPPGPPVKQEPTPDLRKSTSRSMTHDTQTEDDDDYVPSAALVAAFASLTRSSEASTSNGAGNAFRVKQEQVEPPVLPFGMVKAEPQDVDMASLFPENTPSSDDRSRSLTFGRVPSLSRSRTVSTIPDSREMSHVDSIYSGPSNSPSRETSLPRRSSTMTSSRPSPGSMASIKPEPMDGVLPPRPPDLIASGQKRSSNTMANDRISGTSRPLSQLRFKKVRREG